MFVLVRSVCWAFMRVICYGWMPGTLIKFIRIIYLYNFILVGENGTWNWNNSQAFDQKKNRNGREQEKAVKKQLISHDVVLSHTKCDALFEIIKKWGRIKKPNNGIEIENFKWNRMKQRASLTAAAAARVTFLAVKKLINAHECGFCFGCRPQTSPWSCLRF